MVETTALVVAVVALVASLASTLIATIYSGHQIRSTELRQLRRIQAKYENVLIRAAYELHRCLHNILQLQFLGTYYATRPDYAIGFTLYLLSQFFCWLEILKQELQFLSTIDTDERQCQIRDRLDDIRRVLSVEGLGLFTVWAGWQQAIGEAMIVSKPSSTSAEGMASELRCSTFEAFLHRYKANGPFKMWFHSLEEDLRTLAGLQLPNSKDSRMRLLQWHLVALIMIIDPKEQKYSHSTLKLCDLP